MLLEISFKNVAAYTLWGCFNVDIDFILCFIFPYKVASQNHKTNGCVSMSLFIRFPGPEDIKLLSCSTQLSMKFFVLINVKMPTIVGILTLMSRKNSILGLSESEKN